MNLQNLLAVVNVRLVKHDAPVKTSGPEKRRIQNIGTVGRGHHYNVRVAVKSVHFNENLIQGLFALIMAAAEAGSPLTADGINFVNENNGGSVLFGGLKKIADS